VDPQNSRTRPAPVAERSNSTDFITHIFRERLQRAAATLQRSRPNLSSSKSRAAPSANLQPIPAQQQHEPVLPDHAREYIEQLTLTGRVLRHTTRDTAEYHNDSTDTQGSIEMESMQVQIEHQGPDRWLYWRLYTETVTTNRTMHFVDNGIEPCYNHSTNSYIMQT
jgi:hypothetical protein